MLKGAHAAPGQVQRKPHSATYREGYGQYAEGRLSARLSREAHCLLSALVLPIDKAISDTQEAVQAPAQRNPHSTTYRERYR